jgi:hypothetical protein
MKCGWEFLIGIFCGAIKKDSKKPPQKSTFSLK